MERLKRMSVFAKVVELGSFTAAARQLQMSVSSISQTVAKLEDELQVKLLNRSTRSLGLTEAGKIYYQGCRRMLFEAQDVHEQLYAFNNTPIGTLRIGCSSTMAQNVLARITAKMLKEYPGLSVNLVTGIPAPDLIADGLDVVIRRWRLQDSSLFPAAWAQCRWYYAPLKAIWRRLAIQRNRPTLPDMPGWNIACGRTMSLSLSRRKGSRPA